MEFQKSLSSNDGWDDDDLLDNLSDIDIDGDG
eukprot:CAMPEP_0172498680 /NCGR_PEP_ID=MMETSP1066-20121228/115761_1 /TAXON_ID=671091 /ORGANISM="Coscinodiscus wailesii, Strain CCMP2513" /LENGTH=31 /DNA_ID= /DNA_START= /DNA_END= /DNA_ORIENTATION=